MEWTTTRKAAEALGITEYELRVGYKEGKYPALEIGRGTKSKRLRWNIPMLKEAVIKQAMKGESRNG